MDADSYFCLKVVLGTISDNLTQKNHCFMSLFTVFGEKCLRNSITMGTVKVPDDQKLFEIVCDMLMVSELHKKPLGGLIPPPPVQNKVKNCFALFDSNYPLFANIHNPCLKLIFDTKFLFQEQNLKS